MKKYILLFFVSLLSVSCSSQGNETKKVEKEDTKTDIVDAPKGSWTVDKEFDENGNLIRYDSIYSWSSNDKYDHLSLSDKDSLIASFKSRFFTNYSGVSATNNIVINGNGEKVTFGGTSFNGVILAFDSSKHITLDSLYIQSIDDRYGVGVRFIRHSDSNKVINCTISLKLEFKNRSN